MGSRKLKFRLILSCALLAPLTPFVGAAETATSSAATSPAPDGVEFFESRVRPLLIEHCYKCHSTESEKLRGGFLLDTRDGIRKGGESGSPAIVPGEAARSRLIEAVNWTNADLKMPPKAKLSDAQIADLTAWVKMGAPDPRDATAASKAAAASTLQKPTKDFWSFKKPVMPAMPAVKNTAWARNPVDQFILAKLESKNLQPSKEAARRTLIRRATFDLTGLPPTPEDVEAFVADDAPDAYEKLIDRLLASPRYGERWGRYWLDLARYSDTKGYVYGRDEVNFVGAFAYRDWVIKALNDDLPYDQFLMQQIAADQLLPSGTMAGVGENRADASNRPSLAAMGFLTVGRRFLNVPQDIIDDRIDVLCRTTQGLTVACARCHDHKFDPIPTADYYSLYGVFAASSENLVPLSTTVAAADRTPAYEAYEAGLAERVKKLNDTFAQYRDGLIDRLHRKVGDYLVAVPDVAKTREELFYLVLDPDDINPKITRQWAAYLGARSRAGFDPIFAPWHELSQGATEPGPSASPTSFASRAADVIGRLQADSSNKLNPLVAKALSESMPKTLAELAKVYGELFKKVDADWKELLKQNAGAKALPDADREQLRTVLYGADTPCSLPPGTIDDLSWFFEEKGKVALAEAQKAIDAWIITAAGATPHQLILEDKIVIPPNPRVLKRGNPTNPGEEVPRRFLEIISGDKREPFGDGSGRLAMAKIIASRDNPLTARVMVNRIWMHHFGTGLVSTPSDFGTRAEPPSHPDLLDYLACWFSGDSSDQANWSMKKLHKLLMLSATYRQGSEDNAAARQVDADNRMLWRFPRQRLDLEAMRDTLLAATGELDQTMGGRPADPAAPRRSIYMKVDRQFLPGVARAFDFANPDLHIPQRSTTTIPQQALYFMNSPFVMDRARAVSGRPEIAFAYEPATRVKRLYRTLFQREATEREVEAGVQFINDVSDLPPPPEPPAVPTMWQYGYGEVDAMTGKVKTFTPLPHFTGTAYQGGDGWPNTTTGWAQLTASGGHAGDDHQHATIRRWVAPKDGRMIITGTVSHAESGGDGIRASIISSREGTLATWTLQNRKADHKIEPVPVKEGDTIDFVVDLGGSISYDMFTWAPMLKTVKVPGVPADEYDAKKQFAGRPSTAGPPLDAWQEYAQVLMQSNEFLFVD